MPEEQPLSNCVRARRVAQGWSQDELAARAGVSRAGISAIETGRLVPSAATALTLAAVFGCRVEELFSLTSEGVGEAQWAWGPGGSPCRYWQATAAGRRLLYPVEPTLCGFVPHDGVWSGARDDRHAASPADTLIIACCDPAVGLLAEELQRTHGIRLLAIQRSSRAALGLLGQGLIHAAGVHLAVHGQKARNVAEAKSEVHRAFTLLRVARWQEGLAAAPDLRITSVAAALQAKVRWVGREPGSAVGEIIQNLFGDRATPRRCASSHRGVAEAIRGGWADTGICLRLACDEAGLDFVSLREEDYDLCFPADSESDPRIQALIEVVQSAAYRRALSDLPGYKTAETGTLQHIV